MWILNLVFSVFLGTLLATCCLRTGKIVVKAINGLFDRIEREIRNRVG